MQWVLFAHIVLGTVWLGGVLYQEMLVASALREGREPYVRTAIRTGLTNGRLFPAVTMLLMGTAVWMILAHDHLAWTDGWILASIGLWLVGVVLGIVFFTPQATRLSALFEADGVTEQVVAGVDRMVTVGRVDTILLLGLLLLMVFQPF